MKYCLPTTILRTWLGVLLLAALNSCTLYHKVFHPYRLPTPKPSPEFKAQQKKKRADEKLRHDMAKASKSVRKKSGDAPEAATDVSTPSNGAVASTADASEARTLPEKSTVKYDKHGLMKKPKLKRRQIHTRHKAFRPWQSIRHFFKFGFHAKPNYSPDHRPAPKQPAADPDAGAAPEPKP